MDPCPTSNYLKDACLAPHEQKNSLKESEESHIAEHEIPGGAVDGEVCEHNEEDQGDARASPDEPAHPASSGEPAHPASLGEPAHCASPGEPVQHGPPRGRGGDCFGDTQRLGHGPPLT